MASQEFRDQPIKDLKGYMNQNQVRKLIEGTAKFQDKVLLRLLWVTGARVSEITGDTSWYHRLRENLKGESMSLCECVTLILKKA